MKVQVYIKIRSMQLHAAGSRLSRVGQDTFSTPGFEISRPPRAPTGPRRRILLIAISLSAAIHVVAALLILSLPHVFPREDRPHEQGTVELLMVEQKGAEPSRGGPVDEKISPVPPAKSDMLKQQSQSTEEAAAGLKLLSAQGDQPASPRNQQVAPAPSTPDAKPALQKMPAEPEPPRPGEAPVFRLEGTDSESDAVALGDRILPAMPDNRFRNRPPVYPAEAQIRGDHGSVVLVIHVAENGMATSVDVIASSGVESLDQAARTAVLKWHFHPALRDGQTIPFDMPFRFIFEAY